MPRLITNKQTSTVAPGSTNPEAANACTLTYQEYLAQREELTESLENLQALATDFKENIITPFQQVSPDIAMGEYFVIPVNELRTMIDTPDNPEFIHICNAVRKPGEGDKQFPVVILMPVAKKSNGTNGTTFNILNTESTVFLEAYPCPPDPRCPKISA